MFIGNIVSTAKVDVDDHFNVVETIDDVSNNLPTLIIGWDVVKGIKPDADFFDRKLDHKTYWTFKKTEKNELYIKDLYNFINISYYLLIRDIKYIYVDFIQFSESKMKKIFKKLGRIDGLVGFVHKDMVYVYGEKMIFGFDLRLIRYMGLDEDKLMTRLKKVCSVLLDDKEILIEYKDFMEMLDDDVKYIPFLHSIKDE